MDTSGHTLDSNQGEIGLRLSVSIPRHSATYQVCNLDMTVAELQRHVEQQEGLADCHLRLYHKERKLAQNQTLRDARLKDTDFLVLKKVHRRVPDTSPSGSSSSRSQEQHHFVMYQQPQGSAFSPLAADQAAVSDQQRVSQEDEDEADDEDDEGPEGRLILDDDEDSEHETVSRKTSGASDASSTATIREGIGAFSLGNHSQSHFSPFSQLAQTAAEEDRKLEAARQLERLSAGMAVSEGGSHRAGAFHAHLGSLPFPYGFPPVYRLAVSSPTAHGANVSSHQLTAPVITPATSYLLSNPYAATLLGYPTPGVIRHPFLPSPSLYGLPPLLAVSQQVCGPAAHSVGGVTPTSSVYQGVRAASNLPPAQRVSPPADSTVSSTQGNAIVSSPTSSQNDKRRGASALYKSLPRSPLQWNPEHVHRWLHALSLKHGLHELDSSRFKMNGRGLALMKLKGFQYRLGEHGLLAYDDLRRLIVEANSQLQGTI